MTSIPCTNAARTESSSGAEPSPRADAIDTVVARVLDHVGISNALVKRWGEK